MDLNVCPTGIHAGLGYIMRYIRSGTPALDTDSPKVSWPPLSSSSLPHTRCSDTPQRSTSFAIKHVVPTVVFSVCGYRLLHRSSGKSYDFKLRAARGCRALLVAYRMSVFHVG